MLRRAPLGSAGLDAGNDELGEDTLQPRTLVRPSQDNGRVFGAKAAIDSTDATTGSATTLTLTGSGQAALGERPTAAHACMLCVLLER